MAENLIESVRLTRDPSNPNRIRTRIGPEWRIIFTQGGVVMSTLLRAATLVLDRPDLRLASMSATFIAPVTPGDVVVDVTVLRSGRGGAQVQAELRTDPEGGPNSIVTAVYTTVDPTMPHHRQAALPDALTRVPTAEMIAEWPEIDIPFLQQTQWLPADTKPDEEARSWTWMRFHESPVDADGIWDRSALAVPADQLGGAVDAVLGLGAYFCVSLQITIQFHGDARGEWIAIDSEVWEIGDGNASGWTTVWDTHGTLVATATQIAKLRRDY